MVEIARGNVHIHSTLSDGTSSIDKIARIASKAGLDFIVINDHEHLKGKKMGLEGFYYNTLVLIGQEVNRFKNHYLILGIDEAIKNNEAQPEKIVKKVKEKRGLGFIAHPYEKGSPLVNNNMTYPWCDFDIEGFTGMEIFNYSSAWRDGIQTRFQALYANFINDLAYMEYPSKESYMKWKELTLKKRVVGILGSDAHAPIYKVGPINFVILSYRYLFNSGNNYVFLDEPLIKDDGAKDFSKAKDNLLSALQKGNLYIALDRIEKAENLKIYLLDNYENIYLPGEIITPGKYEIYASFENKNKNKMSKLWLTKDEGESESFQLPLTRQEVMLQNGTYHMNISHPRHEKWIIVNPFYAWG